MGAGNENSRGLHVFGLLARPSPNLLRAHTGARERASLLTKWWVVREPHAGGRAAGPNYLNCYQTEFIISITVSRSLVRGSQVLPPSVKEKRREEEGRGIHSEGTVRTVFLIKTVPGSAFP